MISHHVLILLALCFYQNSFASLPPYKRLAEQSDEAPQTKKQKIMTPLDDAQKMLCEGLSQDDGFNLIKKALELGANPNLALENKTTPLTIAAHKLRLDIVKELIDKGASVNEKNGWSQTPLIQSIKKHINSEPVALFLLENGADVNLADRFGTPLLFAISNKQIALAQKLLELGAEVNIDHPVYESSLLTQAICANKNHSHDDIIQVLIKKGAIIDFKPKQKGTITPFSAALRHCNNHLAKQFITKKQVTLSENFLADTEGNGNDEMAYILLNEIANLKEETIDTTFNPQEIRNFLLWGRFNPDQVEQIIHKKYKVKQIMRAKQVELLELE
ncbi:MAG: ankyrin repeat domain-containing protein [Candidatus Dependentiae bacterium]